MYKEYLLEILSKHIPLNESDYFSFHKLSNKINRMSENKAKDFIDKIKKKEEDTRVHRKTASSIIGLASPTVTGAGLGYKLGKKLGSKGKLAAMGAVGGVGLWAIRRDMKNRKDKCVSSCGQASLNLPKRQVCMAKCNVIMAQAKYEFAMKHSQDYDIESAKEDFNDAVKKFKFYQNYAEKKGLNPDPHIKVGTSNYSGNIFKIPG